MFLFFKPFNFNRKYNKNLLMSLQIYDCGLRNLNKNPFK